MNTLQLAASNPGIYVRKRYHPHHCLATPLGLSLDAKSSRTFLIPRAKTLSGLQHVPVLKSQKPLHVCFAGGKGMMDNSEDSQRKALEEAMQSLKGQSIEDLLQKQIQKGEYYGGSGSKPPGGRGGGGGGGDSGSEDGSSAGMSDETLQIVLATIGFIFVILRDNGKLFQEKIITTRSTIGRNKIPTSTLEINLEDLSSDSGKRIKISEYHPNDMKSRREQL